MTPDEPDATSAWIPPSVEELQAMLPQYQIGAELTRSETASVYQARHIEQNRNIALKLLATGKADHQGVGRFNPSIQSPGYLEHLAIVPVYEVGQTAPGTSLSQWNGSMG